MVTQSTNKVQQMFSSNLKEGDTVYLVKLVHLRDGLEHQLVSEHTVTHLLKSRMYVSDIDSHFNFPGGGKPGSRWSMYLSEDKPTDNYDPVAEQQEEERVYGGIVKMILDNYPDNRL